MKQNLIAQMDFESATVGVRSSVTKRFLKRLVILFCAVLMASAHVEAEPTLPITAKSRSELARMRLPETRQDLRRMQNRIRAATAKVRTYTVGLQIGAAQGTGVVVSRDGYVLSAAHVVGQPGRRVTVYLSDGTLAHGVALGVNRAMDAGVIKIRSVSGKSEVDLPFAEMGQTDNLQLGQWCLALGHPGGYREDRPAVLRCGRILASQPTHITTDCTLISGDSGGPLFDLDGRLIGVHSRIGSELANNVHVPVSSYRVNWERHLKSHDWGNPIGGRPYLGVEGQSRDRTARVLTVYPDSPAAAAGIQSGDVILKLGEVPITTFASLVEAVRTSVPGEKIDVVVRRGDKQLTLSLLLAHMKEEVAAPSRNYVRHPASDAGNRESHDWRVATSVLGEIRRLRAPTSFEKNHPSAKAAFRPVADRIRRSVVRVLSDERRAALGLVVRGDGLVVTKSSQVPGNVVCRLQSGKTLKATVLRRHKQLDLALLRLEKPVAAVPLSNWSTASTQIGDWLVTCGIADDPVAIGVVSLPLRRIRGGVLGVLLTTSAPGPRISRIIRDSGAQRAGLMIGDVVIQAGNKRIRSGSDLVEAIAGVLPGEIVQLGVLRAGATQTISVTLGSASNISSMWDPKKAVHMSGPVSKRRSGFSRVLQHDTMLRPSDCGGPVVDIDGRVVGINIARAGRVASYALPTSEVMPILKAWFKEIPELLTGE